MKLSSCSLAVRWHAAESWQAVGESGMKNCTHSSYLWAAPKVVFKDVFQLKVLWGYFVWQVRVVRRMGFFVVLYPMTISAKAPCSFSCGEQTVGIS